MHPYLTQEKLVRFCQRGEDCGHGVFAAGGVVVFSLGMATEDESVLDQPVVREAAARHRKIAGANCAAVGRAAGHGRRFRRRAGPNGSARISSIFDFELSADEMDAISALDRNRRFNDPGVFCEKAFNTFFPIYE